MKGKKLKEKELSVGKASDKSATGVIICLLYTSDAADE